jgi:hypothetical protein
MQASKQKQPKHSSQEKTSGVQILFSHSVHYHSKSVAKQNGEKGHEFVLNKNGVEVIKTIIKWSRKSFNNSRRNKIGEHPGKISHQHTK